MANEVPSTQVGQKVGSPTTAGQTIFQQLEAILAAVGGGVAPTSKGLVAYVPAALNTAEILGGNSGTQIAAATPTADGTVNVQVDLSAMASGDTTTFTIETAFNGSLYQTQSFTYSGAQTQKWVTFQFPFFNTIPWRVRINQTAGTLRNYSFWWNT